MSALNAFDRLVAEYDQWLLGQKLQPMCARELLHEDITPEQRRWLSNYVQRWDALEQEEQAC